VLNRLVAEKHVLAADQPLSIRAGKPMLYRVADTNLRFSTAPWPSPVSSPGIRPWRRCPGRACQTEFPGS
jgi:hypothetical protein